MPDSEFFRAFNLGNDDFARDAFEEFTVEEKRGEPRGTPGTYTANSIDDLTTQITGGPGVNSRSTEVHVFVSKALMAQICLREGAILTVRGKRVRVGPIEDAGDNKVMLICEKTGVSGIV